ncbi:MAG: PAS domain S-box protein [Verrucomicrobiota bacterium]
MSQERKDGKKLQSENARLRSELAEITKNFEALKASLGSAPNTNSRRVGRLEELQGYRALVETTSEGAVTLSANGLVLSANSQFAELIQSPLPNVVGKSFFGFVRLGSNQQFFDFLHQSIEGEAQTEISLMTITGREIPTVLTGKPFSTGNKKCISVTLRENTSRKQTKEALRRSEERLHTLANLTSDAIWEFDAASNELWRSEGSARLLGYPANAARTSNWWKQNIHPDDRSQVLNELDKILKTGEGQFHQTYRVRKADGSYAEVTDRAVAVRDEQTQTFRLIGSMVDVTAQNKAEAAKREISKKILQAQEQERQRVARELHDGVNQLLSSSAYRLNSLEQQISKRDVSLAEKVVEAKDLVEKAMTEVRLISRNLRPSELDDLGLNAALRSLCLDFQERSGLQVKTTCDDFGRTLSANVEMTIYRIAQEALNNVEKHAHAKNVHLSLKRESDASIRLKIRDDGLGFDPLIVRKGAKSGWGLDNMRERALLFHGNITLESAPRKGTEVQLDIPVS